jgi:hypothetical protein
MSIGFAINFLSIFTYNAYISIATIMIISFGTRTKQENPHRSTICPRINKIIYYLLLTHNC